MQEELRRTQQPRICIPPNQRFHNARSRVPKGISARLAIAGVCSAFGLAMLPAAAAEATAHLENQRPGQFASDDINPADRPEADLAIKAKSTEQWTGFWSRQSMLGDLGGVRTALGRNGITLGLTETSEIFRNTAGGIDTGSAYHGLTTLTLGLDTQKAFNWQGGSFNASVLNIHGRNFSQAYLGSLQPASGIEANRGTRLWELWYQQKFLEDKIDVRAGQQSIDQEFMVSQYAGTFIGTMFGWPAVPSFDLPAGGPAYPLSSLGVRFHAKPMDSIALLAGVYDGNPAGTSVGDPQVANAHGTNFNRHNGALYIAEMQYTINQPELGQLDTGSKSGLPGTYKIGAWYNSQKFADQRFGTDGLSLDDAASNGDAVMHKGNYSVYAVADQMVWRQAEDSARALGVFARVMGAPGNRNLIGFSANTGGALIAPFEGRDNDTIGLGIGYVKVGKNAKGLDADSGMNRVRSSETFVELTYQYQITPWWQLQADFQYTRNPGAGQSASDPTQKAGNTKVVGLRTNITF